MVWNTGFEREVDEECWDWGRIGALLGDNIKFIWEVTYYPIYIFQKNILEKSERSYRKRWRKWLLLTYKLMNLEQMGHIYLSFHTSVFA